MPYRKIDDKNAEETKEVASVINIDQLLRQRKELSDLIVREQGRLATLDETILKLKGVGIEVEAALSEAAVIEN